MNIQAIMKPFEATLSIWGKSTALRIPAPLVKKAGLKIGQTIRFESLADGSLAIRPVLERPQLEALLARVAPENLPDDTDTDWGKPRGTEVW